MQNKLGAVILLVGICLPAVLGADVDIAILPSPFSMEAGEGSFSLDERSGIYFQPETEAIRAKAVYLGNSIKEITGYSPGIMPLHLLSQPKAGNAIVLRLSDGDFGSEGYGLTIERDTVTISAAEPAGLFYGIQTFLQLLPVKTDEKSVSIDCLKITDKPKYGWRSFMLDSGRQHQSIEYIKGALDWMAMLKINVFHWHLTEGQGWRIEIKKYPRLTEIGSKVATGPEQQGYYTQEQIREIVAYAKQLHITVVPEIDIPGHSEAALIAYPEMTCLKKAPESVMGFSSNLFCGGREETYKFLFDVFDEVCELFPSEYIHIGGDEAPKKIWDKCPDCQAKIKQHGLKDSHALQIYFTNRIAGHLAEKGRTAICWGDVITHPGPALNDNVAVYWWNWRKNKDKAFKEAMKRNTKIICGTNYYTYLNFPVSPWRKYKGNRTFDIQMAYEKNPCDLNELTDKQKKLVLGMGTCLWTDWNLTEDMLDGRAFPRIYALAEQMWHVGDRLPFDEFYENVKIQYPRLKALGISIGPAFAEVKKTPGINGYTDN